MRRSRTDGNGLARTPEEGRHPRSCPRAVVTFLSSENVRTAELEHQTSVVSSSTQFPPRP